jgi:hypothetical protein
MEAALRSEHNEADLPPDLAAQLRAGVTILLDSASPDVSDDDRREILRTALTQLQTPPGVFLPHDVTRAAEQARLLTDRARRAI